MSMPVPTSILVITSVAVGAATIVVVYYLVSRRQASLRDRRREDALRALVGTEEYIGAKGGKKWKRKNTQKNEPRELKNTIKDIEPVVIRSVMAEAAEPVSQKVSMADEDVQDLLLMNSLAIRDKPGSNKKKPTDNKSPAASLSRSREKKRASVDTTIEPVVTKAAEDVVEPSVVETPQVESSAPVPTVTSLPPEPTVVPDSSQVAILESRLSAKAALIKELQTEKDRLIQESHALNTKAKEAANLEQQNKELTSQMKILQDSNRLLVSSLSTMHLDVKDNANFQETIARLSSDLESARKECADLRDELAAAIEKQNASSETQETTDDLERELAEERHRSSDLMQKVQILEQTVQEVQTQRAAFATESEEHVTVLHKELESVRDKLVLLERIRESANSLESAVTVLKNEKQEMESKTSSLNSQIENLEKKLQEEGQRRIEAQEATEAAKAENQDLGHKLTVAVSQISEITQQYTSAQDELNTLRDGNVAREADRADQGARVATLETELQQELRSTEEKLQKAQADVKNAKEAEAEAQAVSDDLKKQLREMHDGLTTAAATAAANASAQMEQLRQEVIADAALRSSAIVTLEAELAEAQNRLVQLEATHTRTLTQLHLAESRLAHQHTITQSSSDASVDQSGSSSQHSNAPSIVDSDTLVDTSSDHSDGTESQSVASSSPAQQKRVPHTFVWPYPGHKVVVTGTFDNWQQSHPPLVRDRSTGDLHGTILLPVGDRILYKFVVDGEWKVRADREGVEFDENNIENHVLNVVDDGCNGTLPSTDKSSRPDRDTSAVPLTKEDIKDNKNVENHLQDLAVACS